MIADTLSLSVFELKNTLSVDEYLGWVTYLSDKPPEVNEVQMSVFMSMVSSMFGGKAKAADFMISSQKNFIKKEETRTAFDSFDVMATEYKPVV